MKTPFSWKNPLAAQLYTVRHDCARDFARTLEGIATIGYRAVELAGLHGFSASEVQQLLSANGLQPAAAHVMFQDLQKDFEATLATYAETIGTRFLVIPVPPQNIERTAEGWSRFRNELAEMTSGCAERGISLCYHNHHFEFDAVGTDLTGFDILFHSKNSNLLSELDVYWVTFGMHQPEVEIKRLQNRCPLLHLKDMTATAERSFAEVGEGTLPWPTILEAAAQSGSEWLIVEQDECNRPPLESLRISYQNLKEMGLN